MQAEWMTSRVSLSQPIKQALYIDDNADIAMIVQSSLELLDKWQVTCVTGQQAVEVACNGIWDVILLEIALFNGAGLTSCQQLTTDPRTYRIPLILLTSKVMPIDFCEYHQMSITGVIAKPFDPITLSAKIADLLNWNL